MRCETALLAAADRNAVAVQTQGGSPVAVVAHSPHGARCQARIINGDFTPEPGHVFITYKEAELLPVLLAHV